MALTHDELFHSLSDELQEVIYLAQSEYKIEIILLECLKGGLSGASLFRARINSEQNQPRHIILKLEPSQNADSDEAKRHHQAIALAPEDFASMHIPELLYSEIRGTHNASAMFYSIAGDSLKNFKPIASFGTQGELELIISIIAKSILSDWNSNSKIVTYSPQSLLQHWLGNRIESGGKIHQFLDQHHKGAAQKPGIVIRDKIFRNPLVYTVTSAFWDNLGQIDVLMGFLHGDLNTRNILVSLSAETKDISGYYLIDFAFFQEYAPLLYDQLYLELAYLLTLIDDRTLEDWVDFVIRFSDENIPDPSRTSPALSGPCEVVNSFRRAFENWIQVNHPTLIDHLWGQFHLAGVAVGLNFSSKSSLDPKKRLAGFVYAAAHLERYCKDFFLERPKEYSTIELSTIEEPPDEVIEKVMSEETDRKNTENPVSRDDPRYHKLQFLFWNKLTFEQRVYVLTADLPILPEGIQEPKWLSFGLEVARKKGVLSSLWDSVNKQLSPEIQHEQPNPFQDGE